MFKFQEWIDFFKQIHNDTGEIYNDAGDMISLDNPSKQVEINESNSTWRVLGIHHLTPEENRGNHNVYIELLCKQNEREGFKAIHWTWEGRRNDQNAPDVFAGQKPLTELVNIPINLGMIVSVWPHLGQMVSGFSSFHADEGDGNTIGHHSFFVCFQEIDETGTIPPPEPVETNATIQITANFEWLKTLPVDSEGDITFTVNGE